MLHQLLEIGGLSSFQPHIKRVPLMEEVAFIKNNVFRFECPHFVINLVIMYLNNLSPTYVYAFIYSKKAFVRGE